MKRLVKNGEIILDGTSPKYKKEKEALLRLEKIEDIFEKYKIKSISSLEKLIKESKEYRKFYMELIDPIAESEEVQVDGGVYFCRREAFCTKWDDEINWGYSVYKWDGTYTEKPLTPSSKKTFKFKNWVEIIHFVSAQKIDPDDVAERYAQINIEYA